MVAEVSVKDFPTIYDVGTDGHRAVTQDDVDRLVKVVSLYSHAFHAIAKAVDELRAAKKFADEVESAEVKVYLVKGLSRLRHG